MLATLNQTSNYVNYFSAYPTLRAWLDFLSLIFPAIRDRRRESARNAFEFFRAEYERKTGREPQNVFSDDNYLFEWFVADMEPAREHFKAPSEDPGIALSQQRKLRDAVDRSIARSVENAGRQAMIYAVDEDEEPEEPDEEEPEQEPEPKPKKQKKPKKPKKLKGKKARKAVKGWARIATGERTCAWCLMLVSRGPVYKDTYNAGLDLSDHIAIEMFDNAEQFDKDDMNEWHPGCDCRVVPVFDTREWPGREEAEEALQLWIEASEEARLIIEKDPKLNLGDLNNQAQNALRRRLYREAKKATQG